ncbi:MAG: ATP-binding cassette domain-containing protein [Candidatus Kapabacteria bacterium]|nr:ATP-binding cassette domain-containing protein [Candidatus Kapabacteria bacterium]
MIIDVQDVTMLYDGIPALSNVSATIGQGALIVLTGPTGAGKTTFLRLLYADLLPTSGVVLINGTATSRMKAAQLRTVRRSIGIVQQNCRLVDDYTVYDNMLMPLAVHGLSKADASKRALETLADLDISYVRHKLPRQLSGGERHLVALARAIAVQPGIIIADEPTGTLDEATSMAVAGVLRRQAESGTSLVISTHSASFAAAFPAAQHIHLVEGSLA